MNELVLANRAADWRRLKMLGLDSFSSPITKRVYNLGLDEFFEWFRKEPRPGFTKATVSAWRVALEARGLGSISINVRITAVRKLAVEAAEWTARSGIGSRYHTHQGREIQGCPGWELAIDTIDTAGPDAVEYSRCIHQEGPARSSDVGELEQIQLLLGHVGRAGRDAFTARWVAALLSLFSKTS